MRRTFAEAASSNAAGVVLAFHASPDFDERSPTLRNRAVFEPFLAALEEEAGRFRHPVLMMHGDDHISPWIARSSDAERANGWRTWFDSRSGSPEVGWVRVTVQPGAKELFTFEKHVVGRWNLLVDADTFIGDWRLWIGD